MTENTDNASQHGDGEEVFDETEDWVVPEAPDRERLLEQVAVRLDDREEQDGEAPEGEGVGKTRNGPPQELFWPPTSTSSASALVRSP